MRSVSPSPAPVQGTYEKWSQSSNVELDEMPVKERSGRIPFRQPVSQGEGEGDDPREGSPEPEPRRRPAFPTGASSSFVKSKTEAASPEKQEQKPKATTPDLEGEADSPGSSTLGLIQNHPLMLCLNLSNLPHGLGYCHPPHTDSKGDWEKLILLQFRVHLADRLVQQKHSVYEGE